MLGVKFRFPTRGESNITAAIAAVLLVLAINSDSSVAQDPSWVTNERRGQQAVFDIIRENPGVIKVFIDGSKPSTEYPHLFQEKIKTPFPCRFSHKNPRRSKRYPHSVHKLRLGDLKVIGGIGDSITSAVGATSLSVQTANIEDRGYSFTAGGLETWRTVTTVANLLRVFNPKLRGYSTGSGDYRSRNAGLNVAVKYALDDDLNLQAKNLISKMRDDRKINFEKDWKLVFVMIGHNDVCAFQCSQPVAQSADTHKANIKAAVDYLIQNMPRVFVAIISMLDTTLLARFPNTEACKIITRQVVCPCLAKSSNLSQDLVDMSAVVRDYQKAEMELAALDEYKNNKTFTVEYMPCIQAFNGPVNIGDPETPKVARLLAGKPVFTPECTHINQRGMAIVARLLWNNLLEPVGKKSKTLTTRRNFKCPSVFKPYIFTTKNSNTTYHHDNDD